ncbi:MAG: hypothetical protein OXP73_10840, partial [Chloroflexota bacterium]|nr:hypothetical protein [Chloroflexota bacterium]
MRRVVGVVRHLRDRAPPTIVVVLMVLGVSCADGERAASDRAPAPAVAPVAVDAAPPAVTIDRPPPLPAVGPPGNSSPPDDGLAAMRDPRGAAGLARVPAGRGPARQVEALRPGGDRVSGEATSTSSDASSVEALLEDGLFLVGASPVHLAIRGTPAAGAVRCAWRGSALTAAQRADTIRLWLGLEAGAAIPDAGYVESLFMVVLDTFDPRLRETAKANFRAIARGGESREYLFLTCFADYAVTAFLLGSGTTPATVTVAYDRQGEAASFDLYVREHEAGTYGSDPLQTRGTYEAGLQAQVVAAEKELSAAIGGREAVVFLAPMGAHNAIGFEAWQAVAQWAVVTDDAGVAQAVRDDTPAGDPEHTQTLANLSS